MYYLLNRFFYKFNLKITPKQISIPVPWGSIKGQIFGDPSNKNLTPILCLHGRLDNSNSFKPIAKYICKEKYYIIALDFPGHGFSSRIPDGIQYSPKFFVSSIRRAVKYLNLESFILLTHSYGGFIGLIVHFDSILI